MKKLLCKWFGHKYVYGLLGGPNTNIRFCTRCETAQYLVNNGFLVRCWMQIIIRSKSGAKEYLKSLGDD